MSIVLILLLFVSIVLILFQLKPVQTWAAKKAAHYMGKELRTTVGVRSLYVVPFKSIVLEGFYVLDKSKDTLVSTPKLAVQLSGFSVFNSIKQRVINFSSIQLDNGSAYIKKQKDSTSNLKFIIDYFNSGGDTTKVKKTGKPWTLNFDKIAVNNFRFRYKNQLRNTIMSGVNMNDIDVSRFSIVVRNMDVRNHLFKANVTGLTLREKSGFFVKNFNANTTIDTTMVLLQDLDIITPNSKLRNYFKMNFRSFDDFDDFENKVAMDGDFKTSHLSSKDVSYFTSSLGKINFELGVDGRIRGKVNDLRANNLTVTAAKATFVRGDFHLTGLPDWDNTFLQLKFDQIATNKRDLDYLYSHFTGQPNVKTPAIIGKFGNINFTGRFTGLQNDFVAFGTLKTALGRLDPDINLKINKKGVPSYSGKLSTTNFDVGTLIDDKAIGRVTLTGNLSGSGDDLATLAVKGNARIASIGYKGYNYTNLTTSGTFYNKVAKGKVAINDRNVKLDLAGSINLNPKLPVFDFIGNIENARLQRLHLLKDTITLTTQMNTNFSGNNLENLDGHILLTKIRITDPRHNFVVDTVSINSTGKGNDRTLSLTSDMADASLKGTINLATLPSYFKTIAKKYIPSLKTDITPPKPQHFDLNVSLKNMEPALVMFAPDVQIPDKGTLNGQFYSDTKTATLNGFIKTIKYGKIVFHDFIIDESTSDDMLGLNVSLSKVDLTDSLFIKNINVANFLKNDSLNFNVKLSDKDATNQLDLYGLVEFGRDTTAKLKLLPSDVVLERQNWKIQEQVRIRLLDGKTQVQGFELSNGEQKVRINGFISDNPADQLKVTFQKFSMATLNQLTKPSGVLLRGALNGDVILTSAIKKPGLDADLTIDSLTMNKTLVGDVNIKSKLDNTREEADVKVNITNRGLETLNIAGIYTLGHDAGDNLDFDVKMDRTEAIIFEPFVKGLVSDLKGTVSADLKLSGSPSNPSLEGDLTLNNTGLTVDYLKTAYTVNHTLQVNNSIITVNDMVLKDYRGGTGTANGKVDLTNLSNPNIDITLQAKNLLALNTTFKDNHLYYGTAYGSGTFKFNGPVDNMKIDITASTEAGTIFNIPLNTSSTATDYEFIHFVDHNDTTRKVVEKKNRFNGVTLNFDLTVDEKTIVRISTDYGVLEGTGQARNLKLNINTLGDFEMFGDFLITSGKFEFTAKNFISKNFTVSQGGTIHWTGNPNNAEINLRALYEVRTDVGPLYNAAGLQSPYGPKQVLVQAELIITKSLIQPNIDFSFNFPVDPSIKDDLNTYLADNNNRSQQALSIIVRRKFASGAGSNLTNQVVGTAEEAISEFAINKLNNFISQSNIKNVDLNIRGLSDASLGLRFNNDRLIMNASFYSNTANSNFFDNRANFDFSTYNKDFEIQYLIRKDGNLRARYSYRALNSTTLNTLNNQLGVQYVNGLGLVYQRDFDTFGEFFRNLFRQSRRNRTPVNPLPVPPVTNTPAVGGGGGSDDHSGDDNDDQ